MGGNWVAQGIDYSLFRNLRCVRPGIPIYVVDPGNPDTAGIRNPLTLIRKRAAEGMPGLAELLREKYAAG